MKVKRYRAEKMADAIAMVKRDMGSDAVILSTKTIRPAIKGLRKPLLEVAAAMAPAPGGTRKRNAYHAGKAAATRGNGGLSERRGDDVNMDDGSKPAPANGKAAAASGKAVESLREEFTELRQRVERAEEGLPARELLNEVKSVTQEMAELRKMIEHMKAAIPDSPIGEYMTQVEQMRESVAEVDRLDGAQRESYLLAELRNIKDLKTAFADAAPGYTGEYVTEELAKMRGIIEGLLTDRPNRIVLPASGPAGRLAKLLLESGLSEEETWRLITTAGQRAEHSELSLERDGVDLLAGVIMDEVPTTGPLWSNVKKGHAAALIGPTGVGKTTTIAKLAAQQVFQCRRKIAIVTLDTYRIGAVDQLQSYAKMLSAPCEVAYNEQELDSLLRLHADKDLILVDTVGINQRDEEMMARLTRVFDKVPGVEAHLILSATTRPSEARDIHQRFGKAPIRSLILSKLDETVSFGSLLEFLRTAKTPVSYFTIGQKVPEDIETATPERVADMVLKISAQD